jgi:hypothetical protein
VRLQDRCQKKSQVSEQLGEKARSRVSTFGFLQNAVLRVASTIATTSLCFVPVKRTKKPVAALQNVSPTSRCSSKGK